MQLDPLIARGRSVAAGRMLAGVDQEQLAVEAGLSASTVSKIELGRRKVRPETLHAVIQALDRLGIDVIQNSRTGHHGAATSYA